LTQEAGLIKKCQDWLKDYRTLPKQQQKELKEPKEKIEEAMNNFQKHQTSQSEPPKQESK
jgi:hypothetical protein